MNLMVSLEPSGHFVVLFKRCLTQQHGEGPFTAGFQPVWIRDLRNRAVNVAGQLALAALMSLSPSHP